jgi:hypothetical protein
MVEKQDGCPMVKVDSIQMTMGHVQIFPGWLFRGWYEAIFCLTLWCT